MARLLAPGTVQQDLHELAVLEGAWLPIIPGRGEGSGHY
jgi:hypothetical protein